MCDNKYGYSLLFVEDEEEMRKNYVMYLKIIFKTVYEAADGEEAYNIYQDKKPDILIVDINIPKMNGLELLTKIRQHDHTARAIVLTAHKDKDFLLKSASLKLTDYLVKPISRAALKLSLDKVMEELSSFVTTTIKNQMLEDGYMWDYNTQKLIHHGSIVQLTKKEHMVLVLFMDNLNLVLSTDTILCSVWDDKIDASHTTLKTLIKNLRRKLPSGILENVHGVGYRIKS